MGSMTRRGDNEQDTAQGLPQKSSAWLVHFLEHGGQEFAEQFAGLADEQVFAYHFCTSLFLYGLSSKTTPFYRHKEASSHPPPKTGNRVLLGS